MKKFFAEYLELPKFGTLREKVFLTRITLGITAIILCMAALTYSASAYFTVSASSNGNKIVGADFSLQYTVLEGNQVPTGDVATLAVGDEVTPNTDGTYTLSKGVYTAVVTKTAESKALTGFCKLEIADKITGQSKTFYTEQFGKISADESVAPVSVRYILIDIKTDSAFVKFSASWGTCARETVLNNSVTFEVADNSADVNKIDVNTTEENTNNGNAAEENMTDGNTTGENTAEDNSESQSSSDDPQESSQNGDPEQDSLLSDSEESSEEDRTEDGTQQNSEADTSVNGTVPDSEEGQPLSQSEDTVREQENEALQ